MKTLSKVVAPIFLTLVIGVSVFAGELNSPPAPCPTPNSTEILLPETSDSTGSGFASAASAEVDGTLALVNMLISMLSIY